MLDNLIDCNFDEVCIDSDSEELKAYSQKMGYIFIERKKELAENDANGNDLLNYHCELIKSDLYFQLFITNPLIKIETINNCIKILENSAVNDSIFTVKSIYTWFWFEGKPINYDPKKFCLGVKMQNL